jgi:predicted Rossmann-fold nucleotide-binding protein
MMVSHTRALVACPGGFGTCDELFEIMTLVQTGKHPRIPIVLFGKSYWSQVVNWEKMAEFVSIAHSSHHSEHRLHACRALQCAHRCVDDGTAASVAKD